MTVNVTGGTLSQNEIDQYIQDLKERNPDKILKTVTLDVQGDEIEISYEYDSRNFERIRRITGYLVGTIDRFNDAKRAEVGDRVKHSLCDCKLEDIA